MQNTMGMNQMGMNPMGMNPMARFYGGVPMPMFNPNMFMQHQQQQQDNRFTEISNNQDFQNEGPLAQAPTSSGPRSNTEDGNGSQDSYQLDFAGRIQNNKKAQSAQLKQELSNTSEDLQKARKVYNEFQKKLNKELKNKGKETKEKVHQMHKNHGQ